MDRLADKIDAIPNIPLRIDFGYLGSSESLVMHPLPGSRIIDEYMDGTKDVQMNYAIAMKSKNQQKVHNTLWLIQNQLEMLHELESQDNSFEFDSLTITSKPFIQEADEQGWFVFLLDFQAKLTIFKEMMN